MTMLTAVARALLSGCVRLTTAGAGRRPRRRPAPLVPGDPKNICHTWWPANYRYGNVTMQGRPTSIWDGDNPPPEAVEPRQCPPIAFMCP